MAKYSEQEFEKMMKENPSLKVQGKKAIQKQVVKTTQRHEVGRLKYINKKETLFKLSESEEQQLLIKWAQISESTYPELKLLHAIPNGGKRSKITAVILKREGVKPGVPDLFLSVPKQTTLFSIRMCIPGLYIEMKVKPNKLTENHKWWHEQLTKQGYSVKVCYGWEEAKDVILDYLQIT